MGQKIAKIVAGASQPDSKKMQKIRDYKG